MPRMPSAIERDVHRLPRGVAGGGESGVFERPQPVRSLLAHIEANVIGEGTALPGPFGPSPLTYVDYAASGRSLGFIEDFIRTSVLPLYANTHTETSATGRHTTRLREQARAIIRAAIGADARHAVIFCGSGSTAAIHKASVCLGLSRSCPRAIEAPAALATGAQGRPVVFVGPHEHHSNELPWRESRAEVVPIGEDRHGCVDLRDLAHALDRYRDRPLRIGSFSAASNVTGIRADTHAISALLHRHGALSFFDFAAAGPYVAIDMAGRGASGPDAALAYMDAVFLSPHKFVGGPGTPGVLAIRRELLKNRVPAVPGGGTVGFVGPREHEYLDDPEHREEGGTPAIVEAIRAGLVFQLKERVGAELIARREQRFIRRAIAQLRENPRLILLGNLEAERLAILSFVVRCGPRWLHHNFVVALLSDLFGIQARGGCSCAGPYGHRLLRVGGRRSRAFREATQAGFVGLKPGWVRVGFPYFMREDAFHYVLSALEFLAEHGFRFLPEYDFCPRTGVFRHRHADVFEADLAASAGRAEATPLDALTGPAQPASPCPISPGQALARAHALIANRPLQLDAAPIEWAEFESLRWFATAHDLS